MANSTPPGSYRVISWIALAWNGIGIAFFLMSVMMGPEAFADMPDAERALYENVPIWATVAYAAAVFCGALGCIALLLKKSVAILLFVASLAGVVVQMGRVFLGTEALHILGPTSLIMPAVITAIAVFLIWYSNSAKRQGWIA